MYVWICNCYLDTCVHTYLSLYTHENIYVCMYLHGWRCFHYQHACVLEWLPISGVRFSHRRESLLTKTSPIFVHTPLQPALKTNSIFCCCAPLFSFCRMWLFGRKALLHTPTLAHKHLYTHT